MEFIGRMEEDNKLLNYEGQIIIFGAGLFGDRLYLFLKENNKIEQVVAFTDNNYKKMESNKNGIRILSPDDVMHSYPNALFIIASKYVGIIAKQLIGGGIKNIHAFHFV